MRSGRCWGKVAVSGRGLAADDAEIERRSLCDLAGRLPAVRQERGLPADDAEKTDRKKRFHANIAEDAKEEISRQ